MSILRSLNTGAAGLKSQSDAIGVVGDNIANVNTIGFKRQRAVFEDMLGRSIAGSTSTPEAGTGSRMARIEQMWTQGALLTTSSPTDLAVSGDGFFVVTGNVNGVDGNYYTRAGQFHIDADGNLVNPTGMHLQGYTARVDGTMGSTVGDITIPQVSVAANPTTRVDLAVNLDSNAAVIGAWDPLDPESTSNFSTGVSVYDSLGNAHDVTMYFRKTADNNWEWHAMVDGAELAGGTPGVQTEAASGSMVFSTDGALDTETPGASSWSFAGGATPAQAISFDFGTAVLTDGGTGLDGSTQFASSSANNGVTQDGYAAGEVAGVSVGADGTVSGIFSNGQRRALGQVVLATFASNDGLERTGDGLWTATQASGDALTSAAATGGSGSIVGGALEQANIDIGREFVDLIAFQRGFQANSKIIQTADEMYGELVNLKR